jgi:hypothetical protein
MTWPGYTGGQNGFHIVMRVVSLMDLPDSLVIVSQIGVGGARAGVVD